jgi:hypothetical protein
MPRAGDPQQTGGSCGIGRNNHDGTPEDWVNDPVEVLEPVPMVGHCVDGSTSRALCGFRTAAQRIGTVRSPYKGREVRDTDRFDRGEELSGPRTPARRPAAVPARGSRWQRWMMWGWSGSRPGTGFPGCTATPSGTAPTGGGRRDNCRRRAACGPGRRRCRSAALPQQEPRRCTGLREATQNAKRLRPHHCRQRGRAGLSRAGPVDRDTRLPRPYAGWPAGLGRSGQVATGYGKDQSEASLACRCSSCQTPSPYR